MNDPAFLLKIAQQTYMNADFNLSIEIAESVKASVSGKNWLKAQQVLIACYREQLKSNKVSDISLEIQEALENLPEDCSSKAYYLLSSSAHQLKNAEDLEIYSEKALHFALLTESIEDLQYALYATIVRNETRGQTERARADIAKLELLLKKQPRSEIESSLILFKSKMALKSNDFNSAKTLAWDAYDIAKRMGYFIYIPMVLCNLAYIHIKQNQFNEADAFLTLAEKGVAQENHPSLFNYLQGERAQYNRVAPSTEHDLIVDIEQKAIFERVRGPIDFKNQHVLLDLALLLILNPNQIFTKEDLVERIWHRAYDPATHDNLIYVTVRRLRSLIEADLSNPKYILRNRQGYFFNPHIKLLIKEGVTA